MCLSHPVLGVNGWLKRTPPTGVSAEAMGVPSSSTLIGIADTHCTKLQEEVDSKGGTFPCHLKDTFQHKVPSNSRYSRF